MQTHSFSYKDTNIKILTDQPDLIAQATGELIRQRSLIEEYSKKDALFLTALETYNSITPKPEIVQRMFSASKLTKIGPMASVAGILSEYTAKKLISLGANTALVENGGDIYAITDKQITIGLYTGKNKLADKLAFKLQKGKTPIAICSSSSKLGHSISFGDCDLVTVFSKDASLADSAATDICNRIKTEQDITPALDYGIKIKGIHGILAIKNNKMGMIGNLPGLIKNTDINLKEKITKDFIYEL